MIVLFLEKTVKCQDGFEILIPTHASEKYAIVSLRVYIVWNSHVRQVYITAFIARPYIKYVMQSVVKQINGSSEHLTKFLRKTPLKYMTLETSMSNSKTVTNKFNQECKL